MNKYGLERKITFYQTLLYYLWNDEYYIYSTHSQDTDLVSICSAARNQLRISDISVFTRDIKFEKRTSKQKTTTKLEKRRKTSTKN